jgi:Protein of unknown function (DUF2934)
MAQTLEDRIRERAYYLWEGSGRPAGRDEEFWHRAIEMAVGDGDQSRSRSERRQPQRVKSPESARERKRRRSPPASSEVSAPAV